MQNKTRKPERRFNPRQRFEDEETVECIKCHKQMHIISFKQKELKPSDTKTIFKCKCGKKMLRLEIWPQGGNENGRQRSENKYPKIIEGNSKQVRYGDGSKTKEEPRTGTSKGQ